MMKLIAFFGIILILLSCADQGYAERKKKESGEDSSVAGKTGEGAIKDTYVFNPEGKRDPFLSLILSRKESVKKLRIQKKILLKKVKDQYESELASIPFTPLQGFDISSLQLSFILRGEKGEYALIEAPDKRGYTVQKGSYLGKNLGIIKSIEEGKLIIEEKFIDIDEKIKTRIVELKIKKEQ